MSLDPAVDGPPATSPAGPSASALVAARARLHSLAEHVLAPDLHRANGRIGLRATPGGLGQPEHEVDGTRRRLRLDGGALAVTDGDAERWHPLTTLGEAARVAGVALGEGTGAYQATSSSDAGIDVSLDGDLAAPAAALAGWFALVDAALAELRRRHADRGPTIAQLWPEHLDLACAVAETNFGGSPGDAGGEGRAEPYLYVGPWVPRAGDFWNEPYGAAVSWQQIGSVGDAVDFFEIGLREVERR